MSKYLYSEGPQEAKLCLLGRDPGAEEEVQGRPFVGSSGSTLNALLHGAGILREDCYITNTWKERPPLNDVDFWYSCPKTRLIKPEHQHHISTLKEQFCSLPNLNIIVCLGIDAFHVLKETAHSVHEVRGSLYEITIHGRSFKVLCTYHPRSVQTSPDEFPIVVMDLKKAWREKDSPHVVQIHRDSKIISLKDIKQRRKEFLSWKTIAIDVENNEIGAGQKTIEKLFCVGLGKDQLLSYSLPLLHYPTGEDYWPNPEDQKEAMAFLKEICESDIPKVLQYHLHDTQVLKKYGIELKNVKYDSYLMIHALLNGMPKSLEFLASCFTEGFTFWKDQRRKSRDIKDMCNYNNLDCMATHEVCYNLKKAMQLEGIPELWQQINCGGAKNLWEFYEQRYVRLIPVIQEMNFHGLRVDVEKRAEASLSYKSQIEEQEENLWKQVSSYVEEFNKMEKCTEYSPPTQALLKKWKKAGKISGAKSEDKKKLVLLDGEISYPYHVDFPFPYEPVESKERQKRDLFNPQSATQMSKLLYKVMEIKPYKEESTDEKHLQKILERKTIPDRERDIIDTLLEIRGLSKTRSSYLESDLRGDRFISIYNIAGTSFGGRLAANKTVDGEGGSAQTFPKGIARECIIPDSKDYIFINFDLERAEVWPVAFLAEDEPIKKALRENKDIHCMNAALLFGLDYESLMERIKKGEDPKERKEAKACRHAVNYIYIDFTSPKPFDSAARTIARIAKLPVERTKEIVQAIHRKQPNLAKWQAEVREQILFTRTLHNFFGRKKVWMGQITNLTFNEALAFNPQSTVGDVMNEGMIRLRRNAIYQEFNLRMMQQSHDSCLIQAPREITFEQVGQIAKGLEVPLRYKNEGFTIPISWEIGETWGSVGKAEKWFK